MKYLTSEQIKAEELQLLELFDRFCDENNLYYTLAGGTLLGAIRHKCFIPWDDDIDVIMPRSDYNKLIEKLSANRTDTFDIILPFEKSKIYHLQKL